MVVDDDIDLLVAQLRLQRGGKSRGFARLVFYRVRDIHQQIDVSAPPRIDHARTEQPHSHSIAELTPGRIHDCARVFGRQSQAQFAFVYGKNESKRL